MQNGRMMDFSACGCYLFICYHQIPDALFIRNLHCMLYILFDEIPGCCPSLYIHFSLHFELTDNQLNDVPASIFPSFRFWPATATTSCPSICCGT